ncbi:hypothetical protein BAL199_15613 [alpha proteobacterium BAL199]|nr:hypothetical protein BAL199_15613 [alpha proteobacterium BAL199]
MPRPALSDWDVRRLNLTEAPDGFPEVASISTIRDLWKSRCSTGRLPSRDDFPIEDLRPWIGNVNLVDADLEPRRFRWRLIGSNISVRMGRDVTGQWFDELYSDQILDGYTVAYSAAVDRRTATFYRGDLEFVGKGFLNFCSVHLPLSDNGTDVNMLMLCLSFDET